jgi:hypothetical protein
VWTRGRGAEEVALGLLRARKRGGVEGAGSNGRRPFKEAR